MLYYCLYIIIIAPYLSNIKINVGLDSIENGMLCKTIYGAIKTSASTASSEYSCYTCSTPIIGSFLFIQSINANQKLSICHITAHGSYIRPRGFNNKLLLFISIIIYL